MMTVLRYKVAALTVALMVASPIVHAQEPDPVEAMDDELISVHVELVTDTLSKSGKTKTAAELDRQLNAFVTEHGWIRLERAKARLFVRIELVQPDRGTEVFLVHSVSVFDGDVLQRDDARTCIHCKPSELIEDGMTIVAASIRLIAERAAEQEEAAEAAAAAAAEAAAREEAALELHRSAPVEEPRPARRLGALGYVGISSSVLGLGSTIAGAVLLPRGEVVRTTGERAYLDVINYRPPGKALIGVGVGAVVIGNILLALDLTVLAERRAKTRAKLDSVSVTLDGGAGVSVGGRF